MTPVSHVDITGPTELSTLWRLREQGNGGWNSDGRLRVSLGLSSKKHDGQSAEEVKENSASAYDVEQAPAS